MKKVTLFIDHAKHHKTRNVKKFIKEQQFFSKGNKKFMRFMSLKNQIDRDLEEDGESPGNE
jgi:hypothetical protein